MKMLEEVYREVLCLKSCVSVFFLSLSFWESVFLSLTFLNLPSLLYLHPSFSPENCLFMTSSKWYLWLWENRQERRKRKIAQERGRDVCFNSSTWVSLSLKGWIILINMQTLGREEGVSESFNICIIIPLVKLQSHLFTRIVWKSKSDVCFKRIKCLFLDQIVVKKISSLESISRDSYRQSNVWILRKVMSS